MMRVRVILGLEQVNVTRHLLATVAITAALSLPSVSRPATAQTSAQASPQAPAQAPPQAPGSASSARSAFVRDSLAGLNWTLSWRHDWSQYRHPGECDAAIDILQMTGRPRTGWYRPPTHTDTLSTAARAAGQACVAKFAPNTVAPTDLPAYLRVALRLNDLALARHVIDARLARTSTVDEKGSVILDALPAFLGREPAQVEMADSLVRWLSTLGPRARWWRVIALQVLPAAPTLDTLRWMHSQMESVDEYARLSHEDRLLSGMPMPYILNRWYESRELSRDLPSELCPRTQRAIAALGTDTVRGNTAAMFWTAVQSYCSVEADAIGQHVAPFTGGSWFTPHDTVGQSTLGMPRAGRVTLVVADDFGAGRPTATQAMYARLFEKYANDGFDLVFVQRKRGYVWGSGLLPGNVETQIMRWYDHDYLKLPFPVAIYDSAATDAPGPLLIGRDGNAYAGPIVARETDEGVLDAFIRQALGVRAVRLPH